MKTNYVIIALIAAVVLLCSFDGNNRFQKGIYKIGSVGSGHQSTDVYEIVGSDEQIRILATSIGGCSVSK